MLRILPFIAVLLVAIRPLSGCCDCHAPLVLAALSAWQYIGGEYLDDHCQHEAPGTHSSHSHDNCPVCAICESSKDFVNVDSPQVPKASANAWHILPATGTVLQAEIPILCRFCSRGSSACTGLRAHLVLGVMLV